jgi:hypothetical protein
MLVASGVANRIVTLDRQALQSDNACVDRTGQKFAHLMSRVELIRPFARRLFDHCRPPQAMLGAPRNPLLLQESTNYGRRRQHHHQP